MYVSMQVIGNALSGGKGWNYKSGQAASYSLSGAPYTSFYDWKPDMSICPGSGGLLLSTMIHEIRQEAMFNQGSLMLWFDAEAKLLSAQFDTLDPNNNATSSTGIVTGPTPAAIGAEIERRTPKKTYFNLGVAGNSSVVALASGVFQYCKITSLKSGKVLDIYGGSAADGAKLVQWTYKGGANQHWRLVPVSPESYILVSVNSDKAVDVPGSSMSDGEEIVQWTYKGSSNQHWRLVEIGNDDYKIESVCNGKVLDVKDASTADGAPIQQCGYGQGLNQRWRVDGL